MIKTNVGIVPEKTYIDAPNQFNDFVQQLSKNVWQDLIGEEIEIINWIGEHIHVRKFCLVSRFSPENPPLFVMLIMLNGRTVQKDDYAAFVTFLNQEVERTNMRA